MIEITDIQFFGQRRSGSTWMKDYILSEFFEPNPSVNVVEKYARKHDLAPASMPSDTPVIFVARSIYAWLESIQKYPWEARHLRGLPMSEFIRTPWYSIVDYDFYKWWPNLKLDVGTKVYDKCGGLLRPGEFSNPIELRTFKLKSWFSLNPDTTYFVDYNRAIFELPTVLQEIADKFSITLHKDPAEFCNRTGETKRKKYDNCMYIDKFSSEDLKFVYDNCNLDIERKFEAFQKIESGYIW